jgi:hypothetical protein
VVPPFYAHTRIIVTSLDEASDIEKLSLCGKRTTMDEAGDYGAGSATSRVGESFGTRLPETFYEDFASILEACEIDEEEETSGNAATLHTSVLGTTAAGPNARMRPRVTDDGDGKAGNRNYEEEHRSGRKRDPLTPGPETTAVVPECQPKTGELGGGREEAWPGMGMHAKTEGEARNSKEERVRNQPDREMTWSVIRFDMRKKKGAGADRPSLTWKKAEPAELVWPGMIRKERRPKRNSIGRDRSG